MNRAQRRLLSIAFAAMALLGGLRAGAQAPQSRTTFVKLGQGVPGVLYEPVTPGPKARIAVFVMHSCADYLTHSACTELSARGYRVLCANNSGEVGDTQKSTYDYIDKWLSAAGRF